MAPFLAEVTLTLELVVMMMAFVTFATFLASFVELAFDMSLRVFAFPLAFALAFVNLVQVSNGWELAINPTLSSEIGTWPLTLNARLTNYVGASST